MRATSRSLRTALVALAVLPACSFDRDPLQPPVCLGTHLLKKAVCLTNSPSGDLTLPTSIDTAKLGPDGCTEILSQFEGPSLCVVAATSIHVPSQTRVHAIAFPDAASAAGTQPLVLVATDSIVVDGTIDVASHAGQLVVGGGARTAGCGSGTDADGRPGAAIDAMTGIGGGGGAGGSFGSTGGGGGTGGNGNVTSLAGNPRTPDPVQGVVGGCPGGNGGNGNASAGEFFGGGGKGGGGGGAVYLFASSIRIAGTINASGAGGGAGFLGPLSPNNASSGGGGGGGAGGLIALEADSIMVTGSLFANGGGGGGGGGGARSGGTARSGADPAAANVAAAGGAANHGGGSGGNGASCGTGASPGEPGRDDPGSVTPESGGGGGGGGAGVIQLFSPQQPMIPPRGAISPCP